MAYILISKTHPTLKGTRNPWRNGYFQSWAGKVQEDVKYLVPESKEMLKK